MKRSEIFFSVIQVILDWFAIIIAAALAFRIRHINIVQEIIEKRGIYNFSFQEYMYAALVVSVLILIFYAIEGLYKVSSTRKLRNEIYLIIKATTIALVVVIIGFFLQREWFSSRFVIVTAWMLTMGLVSFMHIITKLAQEYLLITRGIGRHRVLLIGSSDKIENIEQIIESKPQLGYYIVDSIPKIDLKKIKDIDLKKGIDEIIINQSEENYDSIEDLYDYCEIKDITYKIIPFSRQVTQFDMDFFAGEPVITLRHTPLDGWGKIIKRIVDIIGSTILLIITSPIILFAAIAVKLEDPDGPIFFKNARIGMNGKEFFVYKIRYMKWKWCTTKSNPNYKKALEYEKELIDKSSIRVGPIYKIKDDPRRMKIGKILEKFSIDEFPQFFNVLKGDMSLVGPRPHQRREVEKYKEYHRRLLTVKPGITGMAQVSGRSDLNFEDEYRLDVYYIENWSLYLDFFILLKTIPAVLKSRKNN